MHSSLLGRVVFALFLGIGVHVASAGVTVISWGLSCTQSSGLGNAAISVGDSVTWVAGDALPHTVTSGSNGAPNGLFSSGTASDAANYISSASGRAFSFTFTTAGTFPYFCALHSSMVGVITVTAPTTTSTTTSTSTSTTTTTTTAPRSIAQVPALVVENDGDLTVYLRIGKTARVQYVDSSGFLLGAVSQIATFYDLTQAQVVMQNSLNTAVSTLQASINSNYGTLSAAIATTASQGVAAAVQGALQTQAVQANVTSLRASTSTAIAQTQSSASALTLSVNGTLTQLIQASIAAATASLTQTISTKVDVGNLSVINAQVQSVVLGMVAPNASNDLSLQLGGKLTNSPTCSCFDPRTLAALAGTVQSLVNISNVTLACTQQGLTYSPSLGACQYSVALPDCTSRIAALNSNARSTCGLTPGSTKLGATCLATCNQGYSGGSTAVYTCNASGIWAGALACPADACGALTAPTNGNVAGTSGTTGTVQTYTCNAGYYLVGAAATTCLGAGGGWSAPAPSCYALCPTLSAPTNGAVVLPSSLTVSRTATYSCLSNFVLDGTPETVCLESGAWSQSPPLCTPRCPVSVPGNGTVVAPSKVLTGSVLQFSCNQGYSVLGSRTTVCKSDGSWSDAFATCPPLPCPTLPALTFGNVLPSLDGVTLDVRQFGCNSGYLLVGSPTATCTVFSVWTAAPTCSLASCPANAGGAPACACNRGYAGTPVFSSSSGWSGTCSLAACPTNAGSAPNCACNSGYFGTLSFSGGVWSGTCTLGCTPSGSRAPFNTLLRSNVSNICTYIGSVSTGAPCSADIPNFGSSTSVIFNTNFQSITCSGSPTCISRVAIGTYSSTCCCVGYFDIYSDTGLMLGTINTASPVRSCYSSAMSAQAGCFIAFSPVLTSFIVIVGRSGTGILSSCCGGTAPDSTVTAVSAW